MPKQPLNSCPHCKNKFKINVGLCKEHLKQLTAQWYKKAEEQADFKDIEQEDGNLKHWHSSYFIQRYSPLTFAAKSDYYRKADQFMYKHVFDNDTDRLFWQMHASGMTIREIEKSVEAVPMIKAHRETIRKTIVRLREQMLKTKW